MALPAPEHFRQRFSELVQLPEEHIDLPLACLLIAGEEYPDLELDSYLERIEALGQEVRRRTLEVNDLDEFIGELNRYLFTEEGFQGNSEDYYDPENSYLNRVLDRHTGIPITLSVLYMEVARRAGVPCYGIGLPGHFIVRVGPLEAERYVDPYNGGARLRRAECEAIVRQRFEGHVPFRDEHLRPYTTKGILTRMLVNLKRTYVNREDFSRALAAAERIALLDPTDAQNLKEQGLLHYKLGHYRQAINSLDAYLKASPGALDAEEVRHQVQTIWRTLARLN